MPRTKVIKEAPEEVYELFRQLNKKFFKNKLPVNLTIQIKGTAKSFHGYAYADSDGHFVITLGRGCLDSTAIMGMTLLHEMAHVATWEKDDDDHGPSWIREMRRLARIGALDPYY